jgi:hypothetical protein
MSIFGNSRMQIRKKWLNQLKNFFNKHFKEYYLASFFLVNPIRLWNSLYPIVHTKKSLWDRVLQHFVGICGFAVCGFNIRSWGFNVRSCGFSMCGLAHLRNLQIARTEWAQEFADLGFADFKKVNFPASVCYIQALLTSCDSPVISIFLFGFCLYAVHT